MGLDNGICIRNVKPRQLRFWPFVFDDSELSSDEDAQICYWRKCWNIRREILEIAGGEDETYEYALSAKDLLAVRSAIKRYLKSPDEWDESDSIWTFEEMKLVLRRQAAALWWLALYKRLHPKKEIYFYDSY